MFALRRFWWKDARQFWPVALFLILTALVTQWLLLRYGGPEIRNGVLGWLAVGWAGLYGCAVGAAAFAGEKETGMLRFLDTLPVSRWRLWTAKSSFAILSTIALGLVLFALAAVGTPAAMATSAGTWPSMAASFTIVRLPAVSPIPEAGGLWR